MVHVTIFVGDNAISVPIMFDKDKPARNSDAKTFQQLLMWYSWMQYKGGFGEVIIPRRLVRVDKVSVGLSIFPPLTTSGSANVDSRSDMLQVPGYL